MTNTTFTKPSTTSEQAVAALSHVEQVYGRFGYSAGSAYERELVSLLVQQPEDLYEAKDISDRFRNYLGSIMGGGGTSASVTKKVYADLGRSVEADQPWI